MEVKKVPIVIEIIKTQHQQREYIDWTLPIKVLRSAAGYYIGQEQNGQPYSRFSQEYYLYYQEAEEALRVGSFTPRLWL